MIDQVGLNGTHGRPRVIVKLTWWRRMGLESEQITIYKLLLWAAATLAAIGVALQGFMLNEIYSLNARMLVEERQSSINAAGVSKTDLQVVELRAQIAKLEARIEGLRK